MSWIKIENKNYKRNVLIPYHGSTLRVQVRFQTILMSESVNLYSPCHTYIYMYQIQKLFEKTLVTQYLQI